jgi:acyl-CoA thioester hydrolase
MNAAGKNAIPEGASKIKAHVLYIDTDQSGVVYHAHYLRWFEAGRCHCMKEHGKAYIEVEHDGLLLPLTQAHVEYIKPALYDDEIEVAAWVAELKRAQLRFQYVITRDGEPLVRGYTHHAVTNKNGRLTRLPEDLRNALAGPRITP